MRAESAFIERALKTRFRADYGRFERGCETGLVSLEHSLEAGDAVSCLFLL